ncbi:hypothetical protein BO71DRAFT_34149, partial [Aspergillus ellipticus CBS 707.79]
LPQQPTANSSSSVLCPLSSALCPLPSALCPLPPVPSHSSDRYGTNATMPHSSRKKPSSANHKRLQVTDAAGWTHVTTNENGRRCRTTPKQDDKELALVPAEAPPKLTLADLQRQLDRCGRKWTDSTTGRTAIAALRARPELLAEVENIVCVGLGSLSGLLRGGWVDRRNVSMFQLAALVGVGGLFDQASTSTSTSTCNPPQDPTTTP